MKTTNQFDDNPRSRSKRSLELKQRGYRRLNMPERHRRLSAKNKQRTA